MINIARRPGFRGSSRIPYTPRSLGSHLKLWLRADLGVTLSGSDVTAWQDQASGLLWQAGATKPVIVADAINGRPGVQFTGSASALNWVSGLLSVAAPWTWIAAFKSTVPAGTYGAAGYGIFVSCSDSNATWQHSAADKGYLYTYLGPVGNELAVTDVSAAAGVIGRMSSSGVTPQHAVGGASGGVTGSNVTLNWGVSGCQLGYAHSGTLTLCEFLLINQATLAADLKAYLKAEYQLTLA